MKGFQKASTQMHGNHVQKQNFKKSDTHTHTNTHINVNKEQHSEGKMRGVAPGKRMSDLNFKNWNVMLGTQLLYKFERPQCVNSSKIALSHLCPIYMECHID
ncbi:hypothetical protein GH733_006623 [Mirounga leonina]|nr:hypothetical protein GH733_006623 [Mirounga leonina]